MINLNKHTEHQQPFYEHQPLLARLELKDFLVAELYFLHALDDGN